MIDKITFDANVTSGGHPWNSDLNVLVSGGYKSVLNLRTEDEIQYSLHDGPDEEGIRVQEAGMEYLHLPIYPNQLDEEQIVRFSTAMRDMPKPIYAHSKGGQRSATMYLLHLARENNWSHFDTLEVADKHGLRLSKDCRALLGKFLG